MSLIFTSKTRVISRNIGVIANQVIDRVAEIHSCRAKNVKVISEIDYSLRFTAQSVLVTLLMKNSLSKLEHTLAFRLSLRIVDIESHTATLILEFPFMNGKMINLTSENRCFLAELIFLLDQKFSSDLKDIDDILHESTVLDISRFPKREPRLVTKTKKVKRDSYGDESPKPIINSLSSSSMGVKSSKVSSLTPQKKVHFSDSEDDSYYVTSFSHEDLSLIDTYESEDE